MTSATGDQADRNPRPPWQVMVAEAEVHLANAVDGRIPVTHLDDGVPWNFLPIPRRMHRCYAQSRGSCGPFRLVERCPCGGTRLDGRGRWLYRNLRAVENFGVGPAGGGENVGNDAVLLREMSHPLTEPTRE